ncbi:hypothetical protein UlMin_041912 [Ulmus minor]
MHLKETLAQLAEFTKISKILVSKAKGNPLALEVLGSSLYSLSIKDWESALEKLNGIPNREIQKVLRITYDALDAEEQDIFLDIACFLKDEKRDFVKGILEHKSFIAITVLVHKSLITIDQDGLIRMRDLIQEMGWDIVRQSTKKLGERSRLWTPQDVSDVLNNYKGTEAIEGIYLRRIEEEIHLRPNVFEEMCKLRLLKIYDPHYYLLPESCKLYIDGDLKYLPNWLRYLHWEDYPGKSLPQNFKPQNLVELHMPYSNLEQLWDGVQKLGSLKRINLRHSKLLTKIPDLSLAPKLESVNLSCCQSLIHIPSLNFQATLDESAYRHQCQRVDIYKNHARTPGCIILRGCGSLTTLPKVSGNITYLVLSETALEELPSSIESLENLVHLDLRYCFRLRSLPKLPRNIEVLELDYSGIEQIPSSSIEGLYSLQLLSLSCCKSLESLPSNINLKSLEELNLVQTSIKELPSTIENLIGLRYLYLGSCEHLEFIPKTLCKLTRLQELSLCGCSKLESFPMLLGVCSLTQLNLRNCNIREIPDWLGSLTSLTVLDLGGNIFNGIPASIGMLYKLKELDISNCKNLQSLPELPLFIESVNAEDCSSLEKVSTLRSTLTLGRWLDKYDSDYYQRKFSFLNCTNLGEDAIKNIFTEFLYKVFCTATTPLEIVSGDVVVCYPTEEIPRWFNNQSEGSSITITLPPNWYNPKTFLGFVVSVAFFCKQGYDVNSINCELHLKTNCGESLEYDVFKYKSSVQSSLHSDRTLMWYNYFDHSKANFEKYQEASLEFKSRFIVKRCGLRLLYFKDALEESEDGTTANFQSWRTDVIDSDTDYTTTYDPVEPPPKRTQNL